MSDLTKYESKVIYLRFDGKKNVRKRITTINKNEVDIQVYFDRITELKRQKIVQHCGLGMYRLHPKVQEYLNFGADIDIIDSITGSQIYVWTYTFLEF